MTRPGVDDLVVGRWRARFRGRWFPCAIGRGGLTTTKREGDGATPVGAFRLVGSGYRADRIAPPQSPAWRVFDIAPIGPGDVWSDDPADPDYNHGLRAPRHPFRHERMRRGDGLYDFVAMTDYNWPDASPGAGSAIFVHCWKAPRRPTAGCVALRRRDLIWIARRWTPWSRLVVR